MSENNKKKLDPLSIKVLKYLLVHSKDDVATVSIKEMSQELNIDQQKINDILLQLSELKIIENVSLQETKTFLNLLVSDLERLELQLVFGQIDNKTYLERMEEIKTNLKKNVTYDQTEDILHLRMLEEDVNHAKKDYEEIETNFKVLQEIKEKRKAIVEEPFDEKIVNELTEKLNEKLLVSLTNIEPFLVRVTERIEEIRSLVKEKRKTYLASKVGLELEDQPKLILDLDIELKNRLMMLCHTIYPEIVKLKTISAPRVSEDEVKKLEEELEIIKSRILVEGETEELKMIKEDLEKELNRPRTTSPPKPESFVFVQDAIETVLNKVLLRRTTAKDLLAEKLITEDVYKENERCIDLEIFILRRISSIFQPSSE